MVGCTAIQHTLAPTMQSLVCTAIQHHSHSLLFSIHSHPVPSTHTHTVALQWGVAGQGGCEGTSAYMPTCLHGRAPSLNSDSTIHNSDNSDSLNSDSTIQLIESHDPACHSDIQTWPSTFRFTYWCPCMAVDGAGTWHQCILTRHPSLVLRHHYSTSHVMVLGITAQHVASP